MTGLGKNAPVQSKPPDAYTVKVALMLLPEARISYQKAVGIACLSDCRVVEFRVVGAVRKRHSNNRGRPKRVWDAHSCIALSGGAGGLNMTGIRDLVRVIGREVAREIAEMTGEDLPVSVPAGVVDIDAVQT